MQFEESNYDEVDDHSQTLINSEPEDYGEITEMEEDSELTKEEKEGLCRAFTLLDTDGDGVIEPSDLEKLLISWGRMPMNDDLEDIMSYADGKGCAGTTGMNFEAFRKYITKQLVNTSDEEELRSAFQAFDSAPPTGKINLTELRHYLKHTNMKLTDDEIDFLYKEEDYWMLEEKNMFEYEQLINKILGKPTCSSKFLNC